MEKRLIEKTETKGFVHKIIKSSIVDGPGNRLAIFMQGCNFDCWYCHNPETINLKESCEVYTVEKLVEEVEKYLVFIDGITISGGEPLLQQEFLCDFCKQIREKFGVSIFIDTNASVEIKKELLDVVDMFMIDVKVFDDEEHIKLAKCSNQYVLKNFEMLNTMDKIYEVRTVMYPGYDHEKTFKFVENIIGDKIKYKKIKYHTHGVRETYKA